MYIITSGQDIPRCKTRRGLQPCTLEQATLFKSIKKAEKILKKYPHSSHKIYDLEYYVTTKIL